jgi:hypothetical protein
MKADHTFDETCAPGLSATKGIFYWRAPKPAIAAGYSPARAKLSGRSGDGLDASRAAQCREMTTAALAWLQRGDWAYLIDRYLNDELSPVWEVKANTRDTYAFHLSRWRALIGSVPIAATCYMTIKGWQRDMIRDGRSAAYIKAMFVHLRIVAGYGVALRIPSAGDVKAILGEIRVAGAAARTAAPTSDQVAAIIAKADAAGEAAFALGMSLQWWLALRAVDVRGQWLRMQKGETPSGITRGGFRWADGLTWDMIDGATLTKVPSKTAKKMPEPLVFDLSAIPDLIARLQAMPQKIGPVIVDRHGMPYRKESWGALFRRFRDEAGVPDTIWMMDTRAGAINDARRNGASLIDMQHQANHASPATTNRYIRERSDTANRVIQMRSGQ